MQKIAQSDVSVVLSNDQLHWLGKEVRGYLRPLLHGVLLITSGFFVMLYDTGLKELALVLFMGGIFRIFYKS
ncbi:MAG: hypothetical protein IE881_07880 [Epsilonproteobacteria bacterium]|nr:hypothetical protein [Campylobacterota bacterium]